MRSIVKDPLFLSVTLVGLLVIGAMLTWEYKSENALSALAVYDHQDSKIAISTGLQQIVPSTSKRDAYINSQIVPSYVHGEVSSSDLLVSGSGFSTNPDSDLDPPAVPPVSFSPSMRSIPLSEVQSNGVRIVSEEFIKEVGPAPAWLEDPAYATRWERARIHAEESLRGVLGSELYNAVAESILKGFSQVAPPASPSRVPNHP